MLLIIKQADGYYNIVYREDGKADKVLVGHHDKRILEKLLSDYQKLHG